MFFLENFVRENDLFGTKKIEPLLTEQIILSNDVKLFTDI